MDATMVMLSDVKITGKLRDTETVMRSLEGGSWKSANIGNSLAAYPTARPARRGGTGRAGIRFSQSRGTFVNDSGGEDREGGGSEDSGVRPESSSEG